jgi:putative restriction endonuclease
MTSCSSTAPNTRCDRTFTTLLNYWRTAAGPLGGRLNGENGLLLTPSVDHLFDRGFIGFENNGKLVISPVAHMPSLQRMGIDTTAAVNVSGFTSGQKQFLDFHRNAVLLQSVRA